MFKRLPPPFATQITSKFWMKLLLFLLNFPSTESSPLSVSFCCVSRYRSPLLSWPHCSEMCNIAFHWKYSLHKLKWTSVGLNKCQSDGCPPHVLNRCYSKLSYYTKIHNINPYRRRSQDGHSGKYTVHKLNWTFVWSK